MTAPVLTVIIPAFNAARTIARAVRSVNRRPGIASVLVIDDGSADDTADLAAAAGATVIRQHNAGPAAARNLGIDRAGPGTHALFLDADDELLPEAGPAIAAALAAHPDATGVLGGHIQTGGTREKPRPPDPAWIAAGALPHPAAALGTSHVFCTTGFTLTRRALDAGIRFDSALHFAEDRDLVYRAAQLGPIAITGSTLVRKNDEPGRMTASAERVERWLRDQIALTRKHLRGEDATTRENLADSLQWIYKHAARTLASSGRTIDSALAADAAAMFQQLGRSVPRSASRSRLFARVRSLLRC